MTRDVCRAGHSNINRARMRTPSAPPRRLVKESTVIVAVSWGIPCGNAAPDVFACVSSLVVCFESVAVKVNWVGKK